MRATAASFRLLLASAAAALALAQAGCASHPAWHDDANHGPFYTPANYQRVARLPVEVRRVLLLPLCAGPHVAPEFAATLDVRFLAALQRQARFEVVTLSRAELRRLYGAEEFSSSGALPPGFLEDLARRHAVEAVLFLDLTGYAGQPPQAIGVRAKLATVRDVSLLWSFDEVLSAADPAVRTSARRHFYATEQARQPYDLAPAALQSPAWFAGFVAEQVFATLPPR